MQKGNTGGLGLYNKIHNVEVGEGVANVHLAIYIVNDWGGTYV
jgi:hypothetical protein